MKAILIFASIFSSTCVLAQNTTINVKSNKGDIVNKKVVTYNKAAKIVSNPIVNVALRPQPNPVLDSTEVKDSLTFSITIENIGNAPAYNITDVGFLILTFDNKTFILDSLYTSASNESMILGKAPGGRSYVYPLKYVRNGPNMLTTYLYFHFTYSAERGANKKDFHKIYKMDSARLGKQALEVNGKLYNIVSLRV